MTCPNQKKKKKKDLSKERRKVIKTKWTGSESKKSDENPCLTPEVDDLKVEVSSSEDETESIDHYRFLRSCFVIG